MREKDVCHYCGADKRDMARLTRERDEARAEVEMLRATRELDEALAEAERLLTVARLGEGEAKRCAWTYDETNFAWVSSCGETWVLMDGGPNEYEFRFCHRCGKPVEVAMEVRDE